MAFFQVPNIQIRGMSACVPATEERCDSYPYFDEKASLNFTKKTGIECRRKAAPEICSSDLCITAAERLLADLGWAKDEISVLVFVTQTPDYTVPATSPLIQEKLGLHKDCFAMDISLGCSGWVYALNTICSVLAHGLEPNRKALLLAGDTPLKFCDIQDKGTYPLFGDAGTATAIEFNEDVEPIFFNMSTDGSGYKAIIIPEGGYRAPVSLSSFAQEDGRSPLKLHLDGMDVFSFGISRAPESVDDLLAKFSIDKTTVDYFLFHQANSYMNGTIVKKIGIDKCKVPMSLHDFGNTSCASIPLTMVTQIGDDLKNRALRMCACGFGVGLSWGSCFFTTQKIIVPPLLEI